MFYICSRQWNIETSDDRYNYYVDFIKAVSNVSYETMVNFTRFQGDKTLLDVDLLELSMAVIYCFANMMFLCYLFPG